MTVRGRCKNCGWKQNVLKDGTIGNHKNPANPDSRCLGSGWKPMTEKQNAKFEADKAKRREMRAKGIIK